MIDNIEFLSEIKARSWSPLEGYHLQQAGLFLGHGTLGLEIIVARTMRKLSNGDIRKVWKDRKGGRACPLIFVILHSGEASLCGASGDEPPIFHDLNIGQIERLCKELLDQPDRHDALRLLSHTLSSFRTSLPGIKNEGLLALHELEKGVPLRSDRKEAQRKAQATTGLHGKDLLEALGFSVEKLDNLTSVLRSNDRKTALAVMLQEQESIEFIGGHFDQDSPVSYAFRKADHEGLKWIIFTQGNRIRLYANDLNVGVGQRGRTETYIECQPWLLSDDHLHYLWLLYSAGALTPGGSLHQLLEGSTRYAGDLAKRLRERIYKRVIPVLAKGIADARGMTNPDVEELALTYEMALTVLFRLLFIAYAEDRNLLPYQHNDAYYRRSLTVKAIELTNAEIENTPIAEGFTHWRETVDLFEAIAKGNIEWGVPAYGGALFSDDEAISKVGAELSKITLPNSCFEAVLRNLLVSKTAEGYGNVDFRALGVREFGTIYEGLLESGLAMAEMDLVLKKHQNNEVSVPAKEGESAVIQAGEVYLHNRSGARKSSGSYYTKSFIVDHLLEGALKPALKDHLERLDAMDDTDAGEAFFDFRVADIAMGSGHFLISAIDMMEHLMADYLSKRPLTKVINELTQLRSIAMDRMREVSGNEPIENSQLLRRLIARRCIYGVDINPLAVQLARLAVWIDTFVPGLPLSFLDRTLIQGNALVGMGTIEEIRNAFEKHSVPLFNLDLQKLIGQAEKPLRRIANNNDSSLEDVEKARIAQDDIRIALRNSIIFCDFLTAVSISHAPVIKEVLDEWEKFSDSPDNLEDSRIREALDASREVLEPLSVVHFPIALPEVFLRTRPGFDVILGNPPWEKVKIDKDAFWARHFPGLRGKSQREQEAEKTHLQIERPDLFTLYKREVEETNQLRQALMSGAYPGIGTGDPDLYKAFCWRFWQLSSADTRCIGVVLPRSVFSAKGSIDFRKTIFSETTNVEVTTLANRARWIFDEIDPRYTIALVCIQHGDSGKDSIALRGPYTSILDLRSDIANKPAAFTLEDINNWNDTTSLPLLSKPDSVQVFTQLRKSSQLDLRTYNKDVLVEWGGGASTSRCRVASY